MARLVFEYRRLKDLDDFLKRLARSPYATNRGVIRVNGGYAVDYDGIIEPEDKKEVAA